MPRTYFALFTIGVITTWLTTPLVIRVAYRSRIFGHSHDGRQKSTVPRLGGLAIFLAVILGLLLAWFELPAPPGQNPFPLETLAALMLPATLVLLVGIYDDIAGASPGQKLVIELSAAGAVWWLGVRITSLPILGISVQSAPLSFFLTVLWILVVTNALNLIDGLDGLAAGTALLVSIAVFIVGLIQANWLVCVIAATLAGGLLGFLRFNTAPARIFLGDTGSLFLGFLLGTLAVYISDKSSTLLALAVPYLAFGLPLLDTSLAVIRRFLSGRPVFGADCEHIHHKLLELNCSPKLAVRTLYGLAALFSIGSLLIIQSTHNLLILAVILVTVVGAWFLTTQIRYEELLELRDYLTRAFQSQRRVLANQILIRKAAKNVETAPEVARSWELLTAVLRDLGFDGAECQLEGWPGETAPALPAWQMLPSHLEGASWNVSIPLREGQMQVGVLQLRRSLARGRMLFQFSSVLDTLVPAFEKQLRSAYRTSTRAAEVQYSLRIGSQLESRLFANTRGEA